MGIASGEELTYNYRMDLCLEKDLCAFVELPFAGAAFTSSCRRAARVDPNVFSCQASEERCPLSCLQEQAASNTPNGEPYIH
ncbi:hypothetical protein Tsubulata_004352 [Turnera subulata]|uniref:Uncharacterized protein n=1 Tax=Turnera subulata TaxID=218843 RepID=A0A9Q0JL13_9ROSI|nr:hypothetical protein Tsubulata_004352 [Turnera subulata]